MSKVTYEFDPAHSSAQFKVRHLMIAKVKGEFKHLSGTVEFDSDNIYDSRIEATIDVGSINTRDDQRDQHLKSADFFDVEKYPAITFRSTGVVKAGDEYEVTGDLTIHGVTQPVALAVDEFTPEAKDPWGNLRRGVSAHTTIDREDFGMKFNMALETGGVMVGKEVEITIDLELLRKSS